MVKKLHPEVEELLTTVLPPGTNADVFTVEGIRAGHESLTALLAGPGETVGDIWNNTVETSFGPLEMRWYTPSASKATSLILFVHGGGWVSGTLNSYDTFCRALALRTDCLVASLSYSRSPEKIHPQPIYEVAEVMQLACDLAAKSGYQIKELIVCGDSAGGFLIATAMHHLAQQNLPLPDAAIFIYPIADVSLQQESYRTFSLGYSLTTAKMQWFWEQYLGRKFNPHLESGDPYLAPLRSSQLPRFPRSIVITAEFDPLRDEGVELVQGLTAAGVAVEHLNVPGQIHGFMRFRKVLTDPEHGPDAIMKRIGSFLQQ